MTPNPYFLWLQGRFVGAEEPNRNGALWTTADLELGQVTVKHGPLNWLHDARKVIGTLVDGRLVSPTEAADAGSRHPYIAAASAVWRWIYPEEAALIEAAAASGRTFFSMECVSRVVACQADACGVEASYLDYVHGRGKACAHMRERSAVRRFADPVFLGGAVILPPAQPGWADAHVEVMRQAAGLAESTYEQAGRPDIPASEWEQLMAELVLYAGAEKTPVQAASAVPEDPLRSLAAAMTGLTTALVSDRMSRTRRVERDERGQIVAITED